MPIPLQSETDMKDTVQAIRVGLVNIGGVILPSEDKLTEFAEHLAKFGCRWHEELQTIWYRPPRAGAGWLEQSRGQWVQGKEPGVPPDDVVPDDPVDTLIASMTEEQRAALIRKLGGGDDG